MIEKHKIKQMLIHRYKAEQKKHESLDFINIASSKSASSLLHVVVEDLELLLQENQKALSEGQGQDVLKKYINGIKKQIDRQYQDRRTFV